MTVLGLAMYPGASLLALNELNLEHFRPQLARNVQLALVLVVSDAVEDIDRLATLPFRLEQTLQINPADHLAGGSIDARNHIGAPDIGIQLAIDPFQLIEAEWKGSQPVDVL